MNPSLSGHAKKVAELREAWGAAEAPHDAEFVFKSAMHYVDSLFGKLQAADDRITDLQLEPACLAADNIELQGKVASLEKENLRLLARCESLNVQLQQARGA